MARKSWTVHLDGRAHAVELDHAYLSGRRQIRVDGHPVPLPERGWLSWVDFGGEHSFSLAGRPATVVIHSNGFTFRYDLVVDGRSVETGREVAPTQVPRWGWGFVLACVMIPVLTLGGLVPVVIGGAGATSCYRTAGNGSMPPRSRMLRCAGITAACWAATAAFLALLAAAL